MKESKSVYSELMNDADDQLEVWDGLKEELEEGKTVFAPTAKSSGRKRKAKGSRKLQKKRRITSDSENDESEDEDYDDEETNDESESTDETTQPLTEEQLSTRIAELKANRKKARHERTALEDKIKALGMEIKTSQVRVLETESDFACAVARVPGDIFGARGVELSLNLSRTCVKFCESVFSQFNCLTIGRLPRDAPSIIGQVVSSHGNGDSTTVKVSIYSSFTALSFYAMPGNATPWTYRVSHCFYGKNAD